MVRDKRLNALASFIIPGLGQILNGKTHRGLKLLIGMIILNILVYYVMNNIYGSIVSTAYHLYAAYDAYKTYEIE